MSWWQRLFGLASKPAACLKIWRLATDETMAKARIEIEELNSYINALEDVFRDYFASQPPQAADLLLQATLRPDGKVDLPITMPADGFLDQDVIGRLYQKLFAVPVPRVTEGAVEFHAVFALWGGSPRRPFGV